MAIGPKRSSVKRQRKEPSPSWLVAQKKKGALTESQMRARDISGLRESISLTSIELAKTQLTAAERRTQLRHIAWCIKELQKLYAEVQRAGPLA
jgi:hypothetical protein